ncbi:MAG: NAD-dependent epimerase/dehydratase family protein [Anaerolineales bacterium]|nr:NAD-dependent epimerase/dehydratase family protein [Anaerolineales bacterium]
MDSSNAILITGANGEIGHGLIHQLCERNAGRILATDIQPLDTSLASACHEFLQGDINDPALFAALDERGPFSTVFHLASILSTKAERDPELAHRVNVDGTLRLLQMAHDHSQRLGQSVRFLYPSSIAAYGLPDLKAKTAAGQVREDDWLTPATMYGCNKLACEHLGRYFSTYYRRLAPEPPAARIDFRCLRFPGLISAQTVPTGGTSDYGPEMLHHAAQGKAYACFVRPDARLPFMVMPDAIRAMLLLVEAPRARLRRQVYNVTSFSPTADEILQAVRRAFPQAEVTFAPDTNRQGIIDSWPAEVDDSAARKDWGWKAEYDLRRAFEEYLVPAVRQRYA